jgi:NAD(P)H-hydrate repair Nnr-like enzyme with NAD(P)H-hydrate dehydratase domain
MTPEYWLRQAQDKPLFEDILWSRPENKTAAGKLLVIGGNAHGFSGVGEAYMSAGQAGVGTARALLPSALHKTVGGLLEHVEFAPSTPSGSFAKDALGEFLLQAHWADGVLLAGDFGRNSETAIILEEFIKKYQGPLTVTKDGLDYFTTNPDGLSARENTMLVANLGQLQKLGTALHFEIPFLLSMGMLLLTQALHEFTIRYPVTIVTKELDAIVVAHKGRVSSTKLSQDKELWATSTAAIASVFWLQNPSKVFEAVTSSLVDR